MAVWLKYAAPLVAASVGLSGCSTFRQAKTGNDDREVEIRHEFYQQNPQAEEQEVTGQAASIPLVVNPKVNQWINYFQGRGRPHMERYLRRSSRYLPKMKSVLRERGLPEELVYVPLIESGFNPVAHSHASAVGYWQFIRSTGKRYNLRIDGYVDERRDFVMSTEAAANYFSALYSLFGDWYLALAAYNTGENRVKRATMRYHTRDFWELAEGRRLPRETRNYVPKFIAAALIHREPQRYGFTDIDYQEPLAYDRFEVTKPVSLIKLAKNIDVPYKTLKALNPSFRTDYVPIYGSRPQLIRVPTGQRDLALAQIDNSYSKKPSYVSRDYFYYRVRRGDTLSEIAQRHRTRISTLRRLNDLGRRSFLRVGQKLKVPVAGGVQVAANDSGDEAPVKETAQRAASIETSSDGTHRVRRGENLTLIARKYGMSVSELRSLNGLGRRSMLRVGQKLKVSGEGSSSLRVHVVRRGENLSLIAQKYGTSVRALAQVNSLENRSRIFAGKKLYIPH
ncbi:MAG: LysM peptidoglycan-binding domain-containing protein [Pseudobdellovibrionaceae bacterium]|nr:LysM peptidoglycan-binding domain-containing protein [Bdellovibrionales bacterium]USN47532.1 MAG: LysM peptidoglycan-binding domain-containing protein [Pseudobdellovibrionaceae bacterium]